MRLPASAAILAAVALVASPSRLSAQSRSFAYRCDDGTALTAVFSQSPGRATLHLAGKTLTLPQRRSGSGARYARGDTTFWIKGNEAAFDRAHRSTSCHTQ